MVEMGMQLMSSLGWHREQREIVLRLKTGCVDISILIIQESNDPPA